MRVAVLSKGCFPLAEKVITRDISTDMKHAYRDYAMEAIIARALPDVRDGCKPVHRRILYAMYKNGNDYKDKFRKSAHTVGEVLGKYHPHGDSSVYDAMVRMAQDFSLRYPMIDGHGNFGSIDGDSAAAMRYTEARMSKIAGTMLEDIDKDTIDMMKNYDESLDEPRVLPAKLPNLLVNGCEGIAVGFATKMPPHNLSEVLEGTIAKIDNPSLDSVGLMKYIKGPDFPTGGTIHGIEGIRDMYTTGRGQITVYSDYVIEDAGHGKKQIVFTSVPYQVNKAQEVAAIEKLCTSHIEKKKVGREIKEVKVKAQIDDVTDIRDETSAKDGIRIVLELKKTANVAKIVRAIYKETKLKCNFNANMIALQPLSNGTLRPHAYRLDEMIDAYIKHRESVVERKYKFLLKKAEERKHILDGLIIAVNAIDEVVKTIRHSKDAGEASDNLCKKFGLDKVQAAAILDYRLQKLTGLEVTKLKDEREEKVREIAKYKEILSSEVNILAEVRKDCKDMLSQYGDERITKIIAATDDDEEEDDEDAIEDKEMVVTISDTGYVKSVPLSEFNSQKRGGKGVKGVKAANTDSVKQMISTNKKNLLLCIGSDGRAYRLPVASIEETNKTARGQYINSLIEAAGDVTVVAVIGVGRSKIDKGVVIFFTERGEAKKIAIADLICSRRSVQAVKVKDDDRIINAVYSEKEDGLAYVATSKGRLLKFNYEKFRSRGRAAGTQRCIKVLDGDYVVSADIIQPEDSILTITNTGIGKKTPASSYNLKGVGGQGVTNYKTTQDVSVAAVLTVKDNDDILVACDNGKLIRVHADAFRDQGRSSKGVILVNLDGHESVVGASTVVRDEDNVSEESNEQS